MQFIYTGLFRDSKMLYKIKDKSAETIYRDSKMTIKKKSSQ